MICQIHHSVLEMSHNVYDITITKAYQPISTVYIEEKREFNIEY